uniref:Uncharacterized protein n=1 Tax=viral metagenome TaxID=1070528 RepID=A0A6M3KPN2_9ZZZZ
MAPTTYADFVYALEATDITGVQKQFFKGMPDSLSTAQLPCQWVQLPAGEEPILTFQTQGGWPTLTATLVVVINPIAQDLRGNNFDASLAMMDNISSALRSAAPLTYAKAGLINWEMRLEIVEVAGTLYWAILTDVTGRG